MYHDLFQICRGAGKSCRKRRVLRTDERIQFTLVAARADEFSAQRCAAGGVRSLYRQICAGQRLLFFGKKKSDSSWGIGYTEGQYSQICAALER